jgi:hypothetical protein
MRFTGRDPLDRDTQLLPSSITDSLPKTALLLSPSRQQRDHGTGDVLSTYVLDPALYPMASRIQNGKHDRDVDISSRFLGLMPHLSELCATGKPATARHNSMSYLTNSSSRFIPKVKSTELIPSLTA